MTDQPRAGKYQVVSTVAIVSLTDQPGEECAALDERRAEWLQRQVERIETGLEARTGGAADGALRANVEVLQTL